MITFSQFINEKVMNSREFIKTQSKHGESARVGFEFECVITNSPSLKNKANRSSVRLSEIKSLDELSKYFEVDHIIRHQIIQSWKKWVSDVRDDWVKSNLKLDQNDVKEHGLAFATRLAKAGAEQKFDDDFGHYIKFSEFIENKVGSLFKLINHYELEPYYGWESELNNDAARVYIEESPSESNELIQSVFEEISDDLSDYLTTKVAVLYDEPEDHYANGEWIVCQDLSIRSSNASHVGAEINSPPETLNKALQSLKMMFNWMKDRKVQTNSTTGLHINISVPNISKIDPLKLVLFMGDTHILKQFNRLNNEYTAAQTLEIINNIADYGTLPKSATDLKAKVSKLLSDEKYHSVNLSKLKHGYLEFRVAGGQDYHQRYNEVKNAVLRFISVIELACDPEAEKNEYLKKVTKIVSKGLEGSNNKDFEDRPLIDILEAGDQEHIILVLNGLIDQVKMGSAETSSGRERIQTWFHDHFLKGLFRAFLELGIKTTTSKQRAELRQIMKKLSIDKSFLDGPFDPWAIDILKKFNL